MVSRPSRQEMAVVQRSKCDCSMSLEMAKMVAEEHELAALQAGTGGLPVTTCAESRSGLSRAASRTVINVCALLQRGYGVWRA